MAVVEQAVQDGRGEPNLWAVEAYEEFLKARRLWIAERLNEYLGEGREWVAPVAPASAGGLDKTSV